MPRLCLIASLAALGACRAASDLRAPASVAADGDLERRVALLSRELEEDPTSFDAYFRLATDQLRLRRREDARATLERAIAHPYFLGFSATDIDGSSGIRRRRLVSCGEFYFLRAMILAQTRREELALEALTEAIDWHAKLVAALPAAPGPRWGTEKSLMYLSNRAFLNASAGRCAQAKADALAARAFLQDKRQFVDELSWHVKSFPQQHSQEEVRLIALYPDRAAAEGDYLSQLARHGPIFAHPFVSGLEPATIEAFRRKMLSCLGPETH